MFFSLTGYMQGLSLDATIQRAQTTLFPLLKRNWTFWLPVQYFQFGYVDEPLQIPFLCVVGLAWTFILSISAGSVKSGEAEKAEPYVLEEELGTMNAISHEEGLLIAEENIVEEEENATASLLLKNVTVSL